MGIISCSLDEETEDKIDFIQENSAFDGRSELIRKAISEMYEETKRKQGLTGKINAVIFVQHSHESEHKVS
jgi:metal-responsive CopG/Arc/MetJ family transcriptional regulator